MRHDRVRSLDYRACGLAREEDVVDRTAGVRASLYRGQRLPGAHREIVDRRAIRIEQHPELEQRPARRLRRAGGGSHLHLELTDGRVRGDEQPQRPHVPRPAQLLPHAIRPGGALRDLPSVHPYAQAVHGLDEVAAGGLDCDPVAAAHERGAGALVDGVAVRALAPEREATHVEPQDLRLRDGADEHHQLGGRGRAVLVRHLDGEPVSAISLRVPAYLDLRGRRRVDLPGRQPLKGPDVAQRVDAAVVVSRGAEAQRVAHHDAGHRLERLDANRRRLVLFILAGLGGSLASARDAALGDSLEDLRGHRAGDGLVEPGSAVAQRSRAIAIDEPLGEVTLAARGEPGEVAPAEDPVRSGVLPGRPPGDVDRQDRRRGPPGAPS